MRSFIIIPVALAAISGPVMAAGAIFHASPLPCFSTLESGDFCPHSNDIIFRAGDGDHALLKLHGFKGISLVGLPPFIREVPTSYGRVLHGAPMPGNYTVEMHRDGKRIPTLDLHMRFILR